MEAVKSFDVLEKGVPMARGRKKGSGTMGGVIEKGTFTELFQKWNQQRAEMDSIFNSLVEKVGQVMDQKLQAPAPATVSPSEKPEEGNGGKKEYVARQANEITLIEAIPQGMPLRRKMRANDVIEQLRANGLYNTSSKYLPAMVSNKLNVLADDPKSAIGKVGRGLFRRYKTPAEKLAAQKGKSKKRAS